MATALMALPMAISCSALPIPEIYGARLSNGCCSLSVACHKLGCRSWRSYCVRSMAPDEEKMTKRSPLDFPIEWDRPAPARRPDIFPQFSPMKAPLPPPLPADPPEEEEDEEEEKEEEEEEGDKPEKEPEKPKE